MSKAILVASGNIVSIDLFNRIYDKNDYIIAIDGGLDYLIDINIEPDILIGDLDSLSKNRLAMLENIKIERKIFDSDKDLTDMQIAINFAIELAYDEIIIFGGIGSRIDHTLANIFLLNSYFEKNIRIKLIDENNYIYLLNGNNELKNIPNFNLSILPIKEGTSICLQGVKWPLNNHILKYQESLTVSNKIIENKAKISIKNGPCLIIYSKD